MLSDLFISLTDAVFSYVIDKLDPAETIKSWLKRDPARLGFQKALARAYSAFARQYPDYTTSLFDKSFLEKEVAPELAKLLVRNQYPDPALLAQSWGKSLGLDAQHEFFQRAIKPTSDFLIWLEAELRAEPVFQALFDSRALDSLPKIEAEIVTLTAEINRGLDEALKQANEYEKEIVRAGGNVIGSNIVVGNDNKVSISNIYHQYYSGDYARLNDYHIPPDGVFQRVRAEEFTGRAWLIAKVDDFLNDPKQKSGMFLLVGDAGVGKTSFMAHLIQERRYLHLFGEQIPGDANLPRALQSLGSQLVTRYQIDPYKDSDTLTQLAVFPDFLERLLRLAASKLTTGEKIVIGCDALDEVGIFPDGNVLGLPNVLPDGWKIGTLDDVIDTLKNGLVARQNKDGIGLPLTRIETIADGEINPERVGYAPEITPDEAIEYKLQPDDILLSHINSPSHLGKTAIYNGIPDEFYHGMNLLLVRSRKDVIVPRYLEYGFRYMRSTGVFSLNAQHAVNQASINQKKLRGLQIPLVPLPEQKRIADKLDALLARVDKCQAHLDAAPSLLKRFRQSVLAAAVKGQLLENREEEKNEELPSGWRWVKLSEITSQVKDVDHKMPKPADSDIPYISTKDFIGYDEIDFENAKHISEEDYADLGRKIKPELGDILLSRYGTIGEVRKVKTNRRFQASYSIAIIKPIADWVYTDFLIAVLCSEVGQNQMREYIRASSQPDLGLEHIRQFSIPLPPLAEQHEFCLSQYHLAH